MQNLIRCKGFHTIDLIGSGDIPYFGKKVIKAVQPDVKMEKLPVCDGFPPFKYLIYLLF